MPLPFLSAVMAENEPDMRNDTTEVPFNDTSRIYAKYAGELQRIFAETGASGQWLKGERSREFAREFARFIGRPFCLPVGSGTDALYLALREALGNRDDDESEVITVANAGGFVTAVCRLVHAVPVYADIDPGNQQIDPESLVRCLGPKVRAVVITHLYGIVVDVPKIRSLLQDAGYGHVVIIEDCSHAHGSGAGNRRAGKTGDIAVFSFYPTKNLGALGDAGAVLTSDEERFLRLQALSQYGRDEHGEVIMPFGCNSRMDEIQGGILSYLLPFLDGWNEQRRALYLRYCDHVREKLKPLTFGKADYTAHLAVFRSRDRDMFLTFLKQRGIDARIHYPVLDTDQTGWRDMNMRLDPVQGLKASRQCVSQVISLPCFPFMTSDEIARVCRAIEDWEKL